MGLPVLVMGASGSGKSASLRNFSPDEVGVINVASKPLPFKSGLKTFNVREYAKINEILKKNTLKTYVIDDSQYLLVFEQLKNVNITGYKKYTEMALNFANLIQTVMFNTTPDTIVYFLHHTERADDGKLKPKTLGKMLDNWIVLEGLFTIVLMTDIAPDRQYHFITQSDGGNVCKSPMGMLDYEIPNDLKLVDNAIRNFYDMKVEVSK